MTTTADDLREEVRRRYAESARAVVEGSGGCGCGSGSCCADGESDATKFGEALYDAEQRGELPQAAALASLLGVIEDFPEFRAARGARGRVVRATGTAPAAAACASVRDRASGLGVTSANFVP